jgi:hypothetical protein
MPAPAPHRRVVSASSATVVALVAGFVSSLVAASCNRANLRAHFEAAELRNAQAGTYSPHDAVSADDRAVLAGRRADAAARAQSRRMTAFFDSAAHPVVRDINEDPTMLQLLDEERASNAARAEAARRAQEGH